MVSCPAACTRAIAAIRGSFDQDMRQDDYNRNQRINGAGPVRYRSHRRNQAHIGSALAPVAVPPYVNAMSQTLIFDSGHADYLIQLLSESLSNDELAARMSRQFKVRITAAQIQRLLSRMRRPTDPIYRAVPYRKAGSRFNG
jgi:hypothetical protein